MAQVIILLKNQGQPTTHHPLLSVQNGLISKTTKTKHTSITLVSFSTTCIYISTMKCILMMSPQSDQITFVFLQTTKQEQVFKLVPFEIKRISLVNIHQGWWIRILFLYNVRLLQHASVMTIWLRALKTVERFEAPPAEPDSCHKLFSD